MKNKSVQVNEGGFKSKDITIHLNSEGTSRAKHAHTTKALPDAGFFILNNNFYLYYSAPPKIV